MTDTSSEAVAAAIATIERVAFPAEGDPPVKAGHLMAAAATLRALKDERDAECARNVELRDKVQAPMVEVDRMREALEYVRKRIEDHDEWWMDCPDRGGFDLNKINAALRGTDDAE